MYSTYTTGLTRHIFCIRYEKKVLSPGLLLVHLYSTSFLKVPKMFDFKKLEREVQKKKKKGRKRKKETKSWKIVKCKSQKIKHINILKLFFGPTRCEGLPRITSCWSTTMNWSFVKAYLMNLQGYVCWFFARFTRNGIKRAKKDVIN